MSGVVPIERIRMALAEAGHPADVFDEGEWWSAWPVPPNSVAWRAREIAGWREPICLACFEWCSEFDELLACDAASRLTADCRRTRP